MPSSDHTDVLVLGAPLPLRGRIPFSPDVSDQMYERGGEDVRWDDGVGVRRFIS